MVVLRTCFFFTVTWYRVFLKLKVVFDSCDYQEDIMSNDSIDFIDSNNQ